MSSYQHIQRSPLHLLLHALAVFMFFTAWQLRHDPTSSVAMVIAGLVVFGLTLSFQSLKVTDNGDKLNLSFGPANIFGIQIRYKDITHVEVGRSRLIDGWGIHFIPFRGWTINLWGFECVKVSRGEQTIRVGTNDSENLVRFLRDRCGLNQPVDTRHDSSKVSQ